MKRIHLFLFCIILICIAAKVSITPEENKYPDLSFSETKSDWFFKYRVNDIQVSPSNREECIPRASSCCRV